MASTDSDLAWHKALTEIDLQNKKSVKLYDRDPAAFNPYLECVYGQELP